MCFSTYIIPWTFQFSNVISRVYFLLWLVSGNRAARAIKPEFFSLSWLKFCASRSKTVLLCYERDSAFFKYNFLRRNKPLKTKYSYFYGELCHLVAFSDRHVEVAQTHAHTRTTPSRPVPYSRRHLHHSVTWAYKVILARVPISLSLSLSEWENNSVCFFRKWFEIIPLILFSFYHRPWPIVVNKFD